MELTPKITDGGVYQQLHQIFEALFPNSGQSGDDLDDFVAGEGHLTEALLYATVFCPPFIEIEGMVFQWLVWPGQREKAAELVPRLLQRYGNPRKVQENLNFVDITRLFVPEPPTLPREADSLLAALLATSWEGCLRVRFPDRNFQVDILEPEDTGEEGVGIVFFEV